MRFVFVVLHTIELLLTIACSVMHILGFRYLKEPFNHEFFFCGLYFMFIVFNLLGIIAIFVGLPVNVLHESVLTGVAAFGFILATFLSMGHAESDFHLTYLSDREEFSHPYFMKLRLQSIFSLTAGYLYLLHSMLTLDVYLAMRRERKEGKEGPLPTVPPDAEFEEPEIDHHPTKLFLVDRSIMTWFVQKFPRFCKYVLDEKDPRMDAKAEV